MIEKLRAFLYSKYPAFKKQSLRVDYSGLSNYVLVVGEKLIFRFPKNAEAKKQIVLEQRILPLLKPAVNIPIPDLIYTSQRTDEYVYIGYPMLKGTPLTNRLFQSLASPQKDSITADLGLFLSSMHQFSAGRFFPAGIDSRGIRSAQERHFNEIQKIIYPILTADQRVWITGLYKRYLHNPKNFDFKPSLIHAEVRDKHILYDTDKGRISGIIDFGSMWLSDPAYDFVGLHADYGRSLASRVFRLYKAPVDEMFWNRVTEFHMLTYRFWGFLYAVKSKNQRIVNESRHWLETNRKKYKNLK